MNNNEKLQKVLSAYLDVFDEKGPEHTDPDLVNTFVRLYGLSQKDDEQALERLKFQAELEAAQANAKSAGWDRAIKIGGAVLGALAHSVLGLNILRYERDGVFTTIFGKKLASNEAMSWTKF